MWVLGTVLAADDLLTSRRNTGPDLRNRRLAGRRAQNKHSSDRATILSLRSQWSGGVSATLIDLVWPWRPVPDGSKAPAMLFRNSV